MSYQICWPEGDQLQYAYIEAMEDLLQTMRKILSAPIMEDLPAAGLFETQDRKEKYAKILYSQACLICGLPVENPTELSNMVCELM
jgi:HSP90 family molecular chaperone